MAITVEEILEQVIFSEDGVEISPTLTQVGSLDFIYNLKPGVNVRFAFNLSGGTTIEWWLWLIYGDKDVSWPTITSTAISVQLVTGAANTVELDRAGLDTLHGQGTMIKTGTADYDTASPTVTDTYAAAHPRTTEWADYTQTGVWDYMGYNSARGAVDVYYWGCWPGWFQEKNGQWWADQWLVYDSGGHFHKDSKGSHHIKYSDPNNPWKDRAGDNHLGARIVDPDNEHSCYRRAAEKLEADTDNHGYRWLCEGLANKMFMQYPTNDRGPTKHQNLQERAWGRVKMDMAVWCRLIEANRIRTPINFHALVNLWHDAERATTYANDASYSMPWNNFEGGTIGWSPGYVGIRWAGNKMARAYLTPSRVGEADWIIAQAESWVYDEFHDDGGGSYKVAYERYLSGGANSPNSSLGEYCLKAAKNHIPGGDATKDAALTAMTVDSHWDL